MFILSMSWMLFACLKFSWNWDSHLFHRKWSIKTKVCLKFCHSHCGGCSTLETWHRNQKCCPNPSLTFVPAKRMPHFLWLNLSLRKPSNTPALLIHFRVCQILWLLFAFHFYREAIGLCLKLHYSITNILAHLYVR